MVTAVQIRRRVKAKRTRKPEPTALVPPMTGAEAVAYWQALSGESVYADSNRFPQDSPELARLLRNQAAPLPTPPPPGALAALMEEWLTEDGAMSEEEKAQAAKDTVEFKANINANRAATGESPVYR